MTQADQQPNAPGAPPPPMERAEFLVDQFGVRLGRWTNAAGDWLQRAWARTREAGEDIWAEAQDMRHRNNVGIGPAGRAPEDKNTH
jgi:hypothetical protein